MKLRLTLVYTVVTVVFFLAVAASLLFRLGAAREDNLDTARELFRHTQAQIAQSAEDSQLPTSRIVQSAFREIAYDTSRTVAFAAYGVEENVEYLWARDQRYVEVSGRETRRLTYDELSQTLLSGSVRSADGEPMVIEGVFTVLDSQDVFGLLRDALIAVLAFALVAVVLAIITLLRPRSTQGLREAAPAAGTAAAGTGAAEAFEPKAPEHSPVTDRDSDAAPASQGSTRKSQEESRDGGSPSAAAAGEPAPSDVPEGREAPEPAAAPEGVEGGLFSPQSGLSPESHLEKRLSLELERAASNDQDLSICFVEYPGLVRGSTSYRAVAATLLEFFGFEDLIFEYGKNSFCILFPNVELNETIQNVEDFQHRLLAGQLGGHDGEEAGETSSEEPYFGISSRNGRLIEGGRMMREARQALQKAEETSGHVMAFKPDPQKYRQFLAGQDG